MAEAGAISRANDKIKNIRLQQLNSSTVLFSLIALTLFASHCSAGTVGNRAQPVGTGSISSGQQTNKGQIMHPAFATAGQAKGLEIWRIENFEPVPVPKSDHGKFFTGDSYIILNTKEDKKSGALSWDVHFWLGLETTQDEAGAAAILTVQLDDLLRGAPIQHREVQEHESPMFLSYFRNSIRYAAGGVASGFQHVTTNAEGEKRLFHVKGKRNVRVREVGLSFSNMNKGDCFILDAGRDIYVYVGQKSKRVEKLKAISAANQIRDQDHNGRAQVHIVDEFSSLNDQEEFFRILGSGSPSTVPEETTSEDDAEFETKDAAAVTLYKVSDANGQLQVDTISQKPIRQEFLKTEDCFILDTGSALYVWVGKRATQTEKTQSIARAQSFIQTKKYPAWTPVHRIVEGAETAPFKQYFATWRDTGMTHSRLIRAANDDDSDTATDEEFDPSVLHALKKSGGRALGFMPDNGEGSVEIWGIDGKDIVPVDPDTYGVFFGDSCYVIKYHYVNKRGGEGYIIYYWQGNKSSRNDRASSAMHAVRLDHELGGSAVQVRVVQGHEPRHFLKVSKGHLITYIENDAGGKAKLFRIRGTCAEDVRADEQPLTAGSLASGDVFILNNLFDTYIWHGKGASAFEKEMAARVVGTISPGIEAKTIQEGDEPQEFWTALGGKTDYDTELDAPGAPFLEPRLFHCQILANGKFRVEEVHDYEQDDLDVDDIMVLDGGDEIYIWEGQGSTEEEKEKSVEMANLYVRTDPSERSEETVPIIKVRQGHEPRSFKRLFPAWNDKLWEVSQHV